MSGFFFPKDELNDVVQNNTFEYATAGWSDVLRNSIDWAVKRNSPLATFTRWNELQEKQDYLKPGDDGTLETLRGLGYDDEYLNKLQQRRVLSKQEANERYGIEKVLTFDNDITEEAAQIIRRRKDEELMFNEISERTKGVTKNVAGFLAEMAVSMLDPVNFALNFVPVVGEARYAALLAKYGKTRARLLRGALEGLAGQAMVEPVIFSTLWYEKADYDMYDSMLSLLGGAVGGAGLHELFGVVGDTVRGYKLRTAQRALRAGIIQNVNGQRVNVEHIFDMDENVKPRDVFDSPLIDDKSKISPDLEVKFNEAERLVKLPEEDVEFKPEPKPQEPVPRKTTPEEPSKDLGLHKDIVESNIETIIDGSELTKIGDQLGSNPGGLYLDKGGQKWYVKFLPDQVHARNELLANFLYRLAGLNVPELRLTEIDDKLGLASRWVEGAREIHPVNITPEVFDKLTDEQKRQLWTGFVVDAWLANWDAVSSKNIVILPDGNLMRIDYGGSLMYRAMGEQKGESFKNTVDELTTMRSRYTSPEGHIIYGEIPQEMLDEGAARVLSISNLDINEALDAAGIVGKLRQELLEKLIARQHYIELKFPKVAESSHYKLFNGIQTLYTHTSAVKKIKETIEKVKSKYTTLQKNVMDIYVDNSSELNRYLWLPDEAKKIFDATYPNEAKNFKTMIKALDSAMKKYKFESPIQVWRGVHLENAVFINPETNASFKIDLTNYRDAIGSIVRHRGYLTASLMKSDTVKSYSLIYRLDVPEGYNAVFPNVATREFLRTENQVILPRNTLFEITGAIIDPEDYSRIIVSCKVLPQQGTIVSKKKSPKTVKQLVDDSIAAAKDPTSSAADPEPLSTPVKDPSEVVKDVDKPITSVDEVMSSAQIKELITQITELENDVKLYDSLKGTKPVDEPRPGAYIQYLNNEIALANTEIEVAKSKLEALQAAFECVARNL